MYIIRRIACKPSYDIHLSYWARAHDHVNALHLHGQLCIKNALSHQSMEEKVLQQKIVVLLLLMSILLNGCAVRDAEKNSAVLAEEEKEIQTDTYLEQSALEFTYEKPKQSPHVLIDRNGYATNDTKQAFFVGKELPTQFEILDMQTNEVVYEGVIEKSSYDEKNECYFAIGDFTDFQEQGNYYIRADIIGQSYEFAINKNIFKEAYQKVTDSFYYHRCGDDLEGENEENNHKACHTGETYLEYEDTVIDTLGGWHTDRNFNKDVVKGTKIVSDLLLTYEILYEAPTDATMTEEKRRMQELLTEVSYEIHFLLKMQNKETGAFYAGVKSNENMTESAPEQDGREFYVLKESDEATAECAAVLAQFGRIYKALDEELAQSCVEAATKAFDYLLEKENFDDLTYYAACELYKTTGNMKYYQYIQNYIDAENKKEVSKFDRKFYGDIAYLTTTNKVDLEYCTLIMNDLMKRAEQIAKNSDEDRYLVYSENGKRSTDIILQNTFVLALVDHIVTSYEYLGIIKDQLHYLYGRNEESVQLITQEGIRLSITDDEDYDLHLQSTLVFILYELIEREDE